MIDYDALNIEGDFNSLIGKHSNDFQDMHGSYGFQYRNEEETRLLDICDANYLMVCNSNMPSI